MSAKARFEPGAPSKSQRAPTNSPEEPNFLSSVSRGVVKMGMSLADEITPVQSLFERYENVPASLADACLVRMSELYERCRVFTLDADFQVYRRHGRKVIPLLWPGLRPIP